MKGEIKIERRLFISKEIIELHGVKIWVESEGRNKGSTFIIRLPVNK